MDGLEQDDVSDIELDVPYLRPVEQHRVLQVLLGDLGAGEREAEDVGEGGGDLCVQGPGQVPGFDDPVVVQTRPLPLLVVA